MCLTCPCCGSSSIEDKSLVIHPRNAKVAGVPIDLGQVPYSLFVCTACTLHFKHPLINTERLLACYENAPHDNWAEPANPRKRQFDVIKSVIESRSPGPSILDVGCFDGAILKYLGDEWDRYGVEPSIAAANKAQLAGIKIISNVIETIPKNDFKFDAILLIDVAEHLPNPREFFEKLVSLIKPNGILIILTGNATSWPFQLQLGRYWYVSLPEHILFWSPTAFNKLLIPMGLELEYSTKISHIRTSSWRRTRDVVRNILNQLAWRFLGAFSKNMQNKWMPNPAPLWISAKDHSLIVFRKAAS